jgi:hypothetical protein
MEATMNLARIFAVVVTLGVLSTASSQEAPKQDSTQPAQPAAGPPASGSQAQSGGKTAQTPNAPPAGAAQPAAGTQEPEKPPPPPSAAVGKTGVVKDNEFIPTEEIQPDEAVTFPVDI